ncbi:hypothetical protein [Thermoleptolyngbya sp. M55_K2018_002]|uniref:hypothetical protein n=1 Tax=Thermoleptolyngbya sp. M55_K2018_002 TaxID=2747808 RepID=UPI0019E8A2C4|nr:hypothetical protein [Thermoleptolyngbya sp. M55_K2018_002]HIK42145.1 hypothetical protein [Thermoleptolyngbya sp. M55_K2018_002]
MPNLIQLHEAIALIAPIHGVADTGGGTFRIDWVDEPAEVQEEAAQEAIAAYLAQPDPPDWDGLLDDLQDSAAFGRAFAAGNESVAASNALQLVMLSLSGTKRLPNLVYGFNNLRSAMATTSAGDFSVSELEWIVERLTARHFPLAGFDLT